jgi:hypothetical protein
MNAKRILLCTALAVGFLGSTTAANAAQGLDPGAGVPVLESTMYPALENWNVDSQSFISQLKQARSAGQVKAASDVVTVYRPIPICRLVDTRGFAAAVAVAGPIAANTTTNIAAAGNCGIPNNGYVSGLSLSFHVQNLTVNNGGFITFVQQGSPIAGTNAVFNPGAQWTAATANVSIPNGTGNFAMRVANSTVQVIIDVNGYYQDMNELDTITQLDINGDTAGQVLDVRNATDGANAIGAYATGTGHALMIGSGSLAVSGMGVGASTRTAFIHQINTAGAFGAGGTLCAGFPHYTVLENIHSNGDPNAMLLITARYNTGLGPNVPMEVQYVTTGCGVLAENRWAIRRTDNAAWPNGHRINVLIIKP